MYTLFGIDDLAKIAKKNDDLCVPDSIQLLLKTFEAYNEAHKSFSHAPQIDIRKVQIAFGMATYYHNGIPRKSGEPYMCHPIAVSMMSTMYLNKLEDKTTAACAALLHDVLEDTNCTEQEIEENLGKDVARCVRNLTYEKTEDKAVKEKQLFNLFENAIKTEDTVVVVVKTFDKVHNLLTCSALSREKQLRMARETDKEICYMCTYYLKDRLLENKIRKLAYHIENPYDSYLVQKKLEEEYGTLHPGLTRPLSFDYPVFV